MILYGATVVPVKGTYDDAFRLSLEYTTKAAGLISRLPRLVCVQAEKSNAIHRYVESGFYNDAARPDTIADSISVSIPSNAHMARKAILDSGGFSITASDNEILEGQRTLAAKTGVFAEPACSAVVAAMKKLRGSKRLGRKEQIVLLITGHGLKDVDAAMRGIELPKAVEPTLAAVEAALKTRAKKGVR
jgi:threonine synthase